MTKFGIGKLGQKILNFSSAPQKCPADNIVGNGSVLIITAVINVIFVNLVIFD